MALYTLYKNFLRQDEGVTAIEYVMIAALVASAIIVAVTLTGNNLATLYNTVVGHLHT